MTQCLLVFGAIVIFLFSCKDAEKYLRIVLWLTLVLYCLLSYFTRLLWKRLVRKRLQGEKARAMLLVTDDSTVLPIIRRFGEHSLEGIYLCGVVLVNWDGTGESVEGIPVVASLDGAAKYICREWIDEVFIGVGEAALMSNDLIDKCREMGVTLHLQMTSFNSGKQVIEKVAGIPVMTSSIHIASPLQLMLKRLMDILGGLVLILAAMLAILVVGPIIKWKSPGPILYRQERIGRNGKRFMMYKIRSMCMDADARKQELMSQNRVENGMMFKMDFDPRIIGNEVLPDGTRKTGIGEFI